MIIYLHTIITTTTTVVIFFKNVTQSHKKYFINNKTFNKYDNQMKSKVIHVNVMLCYHYVIRL